MMTTTKKPAAKKPAAPMLDRAVQDAFVLQLDDAKCAERRTRSIKLRALHERMLLAAVPASHWLWRQLDDAYNAD